MDIKERKTTDFIINGLLLQMPLDSNKYHRLEQFEVL